MMCFALFYKGAVMIVNNQGAIQPLLHSDGVALVGLPNNILNVRNTPETLSSIKPRVYKGLAITAGFLASIASVIFFKSALTSIQTESITSEYNPLTGPNTTGNYHFKNLNDDGLKNETAETNHAQEIIISRDPPAPLSLWQPNILYWQGEKYSQALYKRKYFKLLREAGPIGLPNFLIDKINHSTNFNVRVLESKVLGAWAKKSHGNIKKYWEKKVILDRIADTHDQLINLKEVIIREGNNMYSKKPSFDLLNKVYTINKQIEDAATQISNDLKKLDQRRRR